MWGRSGSPIGLPVVMSAQPMPDVGLAAGLLKLLAVTVAAEIEGVEAATAQGLRRPASACKVGTSTCSACRSTTNGTR